MANEREGSSGERSVLTCKRGGGEEDSISSLASGSTLVCLFWVSYTSYVNKKKSQGNYKMTALLLWKQKSPEGFNNSIYYRRIHRMGVEKGRRHLVPI